MLTTKRNGGVVVNVVNRKTRKGTLLRLAKEHYLRSDISCQIQSCPNMLSEETMARGCGTRRTKVSSKEDDDEDEDESDYGLVSALNELQISDNKTTTSAATRSGGSTKDKLIEDVPFLSSSASHYIIPDLKILTHFLELLEMPNLCDIIMTQTVLQEIQNASSRHYARIRAILRDPRRRAIVCYNENFLDTYVERNEKESIENRNARAMMKVAEWYQSHLISFKSKIRIVVITEDAKIKTLFEDMKDKTFDCCTMTEYLAKYNPKAKDLKDLCDSLTQVMQTQQKDESINSTLNIASDHYFEEHKDPQTLEAGVKSGIYFQGILRVNANNTAEAYVRLSSNLSDLNLGEFHVPTNEEVKSGLDLFIPNHTLRNRALHMDTVVVVILPKHQWMGPSNAPREGNDEDETETTVEQDTSSSSAKKLPTGKVIGIANRISKPFVATIQLDQNITQSRRQEKVLSIPMDVKIPKIRIATRQANKLANSRIVVRIDSWSVNSQYPDGHFVQELGEIGELETEIQAILVEHSISKAAFSPNMVAHLPSTPEEWKPSPEELASRRDLRGTHLIMSIDPLGSTDIDDALSVKYLKNKTIIEVGVHIADVTYFVPQNSLLDIEARSRSTTVYLADRRYEMLPSILSSHLCSLQEKQDRYAVSVIWQFDAKTMNVIDTWYGRTIIHSAHALHYQQAQDIMDGRLTEEKANFSDYKQVKHDLLLMAKVANVLRERSYKKGALELSSMEVRFEITDAKKPTKIVTKQELEVNKMVAIFMVSANIAVAEKIFSVYPSTALLRRHPFPRPSDFKELIACAALKGFFIDTSSNASLSQSLAAAVDEKDPDFNFIIRMLATRAMSEAQYVCTGDYLVDELYHYGLAAEKYTHYTSPIRRYADVMVHRMLLRAIANPPLSPPIDNASLRELCQHLNRKKREADNAQDDSTELFQMMYFRDRPANAQDILEDGVIMRVRRNGFHVLIPKYGLKGNVYVKDKDGKSLIPPDGLRLPNVPSTLSIVDYEIDEERQQCILKTNTKQQVVVTLFDRVAVRISVGTSRSHVPPINLHFVRFGISDAKKDNTPVKIKELIERATKAADEGKKKSENIDNNLNLLLSPEVSNGAIDSLFIKRYRQPNVDRSIYELFELHKDVSFKERKESEREDSERLLKLALKKYDEEVDDNKVHFL